MHLHRSSSENIAKDEWMIYYKVLTDYAAREGHCNIKTKDKRDYLPPNHGIPRPQLMSRWIRSQRAAKRAGTLEPYKEVLLNRVKFQWTPSTGPDGSKWHRHYDNLKAFQTTHGHCNLPRDYPDRRLLKWCSEQRFMYRNTQKGQSSSSQLKCLSAGRIELLEAIHFEWGEERVVTPWETRFARAGRVPQSARSRQRPVAVG